MAFGLPVEGDEGPFAGDASAEVMTCGPDERVGDVLHRLLDEDSEQAVVVNEHDVVLGVVEAATSQPSPEESVATVMRLSPTTVRPSVLSSSLADAESPVIVTDSEGRLMGVVKPEPAPESESASEMQRLQSTFLEIAHAVEEHFDGDPSEEEVRAFLHERLVAEGRTPEEAEAYLSAMERSSE
jgi:predicted transcriptional regulator